MNRQDAKTPKNATLRRLSFSFVVLHSVLITSCHRKPKEVQAPAIEVKKGTVEEVVEEIGVLTPATSVEIRSEITGQVTEILADVGDYVRKGQVLARVRGGFEAEEYQTAEIRSPISGVVIDRKTGDFGVRARRAASGSTFSR